MAPLKRYEIFRKPRFGDTVWMESTEKLEDATTLAVELSGRHPGDYFIFDRAEQKFMDAAQKPAVRTLIVDDHAHMRQGLRSTLENLENVEIVGEAIDGRDAVERARQLEPDLIIMDARMPGLDGLSAGQMIKKSRPQTIVVILSLYAQKPFVDLARQLGLNGYVAKDQGARALLDGIQALLRHPSDFLNPSSQC